MAPITSNALKSSCATVQTGLALTPRIGSGQDTPSRNTLEARALDAHEHEPIPGVNVLLSVSSIPDGTYTVTFPFIGYRAHRVDLSFLRENTVFEVILEEQEIEEKIAMDPSGISIRKGIPGFNLWEPIPGGREPAPGANGF